MCPKFKIQSESECSLISVIGSATTGILYVMEKLLLGRGHKFIVPYFYINWLIKSKVRPFDIEQRYNVI